MGIVIFGPGSRALTEPLQLESHPRDHKGSTKDLYATFTRDARDTPILTIHDQTLLKPDNGILHYCIVCAILFLFETRNVEQFLASFSHVYDP